MIRGDLLRRACLGLDRRERLLAATGGAAGGALMLLALRLVDEHWPTLLDPIRPH